MNDMSYSMKKLLLLSMTGLSILLIVAIATLLSLKQGSGYEETRSEPRLGPYNSQAIKDSLYARPYQSERPIKSWKSLKGINLQHLDSADLTIENNRALWEPKNGPTTHLWEVTDDPNATLSKDDLEDLWALYNRSFHAVISNGWDNASKARKAGFTDHAADGIQLHWRSDEFMRDSSLLTPSKPELLMFRNISKGPPRLVGIMFFAKSRDSYLDPPGKNAILPHFHIYDTPFCYKSNILRTTKPPCDGNLFTNQGTHSPLMFHIWFVKGKKGGPFATNMNMLEGNFSDAPSIYNKSRFFQRVARLDHVNTSLGINHVK